MMFTRSSNAATRTPPGWEPGWWAGSRAETGQELKGLLEAGEFGISTRGAAGIPGDLRPFCQDQLSTERVLTLNTCL